MHWFFPCFARLRELLGSALLGGVGAGVFGSIEEGVAAMVQPRGQLEPDPGRHRLYRELSPARLQVTCGR